MPIPSLDTPITGVDDVGNDLDAIASAIAALPATPHEADLPAIVAIVASLNTAAANLRTIVSELLTVVATTRIG